MNNLDQLFIRACKTHNPLKRLRSLYRRFCTHSFVLEDEMWSVISVRLMRIYFESKADTGVDFMMRLLVEMHPDNGWRYGVEPTDSKYLAQLKVFVKYIRYQPWDDYPARRVPARCR